MTEQVPDDGRPRWSAAEAARRCRVGRSTIQRALSAGRIPGALQTAEGWSIPLDGLLAAGFTPDRPAMPEGDRAPDRGHARTGDQGMTEGDRLAALRAELAAAQHRAEVEHARRVAAEALATERAERVADLRLALRQITAAPDDAQDTAPMSAPLTSPRPPAPPPSSGRARDRVRYRVRRWLDG